MHEFAKLSLPAVPPFLLDMPQLSVREMEIIDEVVRVRKGTGSDALNAEPAQGHSPAGAGPRVDRLPVLGRPNPPPRPQGDPWPEARADTKRQAKA